jgi:glucokinase
MQKNQAAQPATIRNHNRRLVLETLEKQGRISRADLAKMTRISEPTVSGIIETFIRKGLVRELGPGETASGRRPVLLEFDPASGYAIGIDVGGTHIKMGLSDLGGNLLCQKKISSKTIGTGETAVAGLAELIRAMIAENHLDKTAISGVGLALPGIVDPDQGKVSFAPTFRWHDFPVRQILERQAGLEVSVENDVNAAAWAEKQWGVARDFQDFVFISIGTGIGAGLILDGEIHRGHGFAAGEIGYSIIDLQWLKRTPDPDNLSFGCLESLAAAPGILSRGRELGLVIKDRAGETEGPPTTEAIFTAASEGDPLALQVVEEISDYLAVGLINIALLLSPEAMVIGGAVSRAGAVLLEPLKKKIEAVSPLKPLLLLSSMPDDAGLKGSIALAVRRAKQKLVEG